MKFPKNKFLPHLLVILGFMLVSVLYFSPVLSGKAIFQNDIKQYIGMAQQQKDFREQTGTETYWTNSAFGGMPTFQLGAKYPDNYIKQLDLGLRFLPRPADYLFLYLLGFYVLLMVLKVDYKTAVLGALAFGFSTYLIIILGVGHNAKAHAIAYMPLVLSGILLVFQKRYLFGFLLTAVALGLELCANHPQMTYYLLLLTIVLGIVYLIDAYKKKDMPHFFKSIGILVVSAVLALGMNATSIMATQEYAKSSTRGESELTINPDGSSKEATSGLDKDYITEYSYGIAESFNLFIPRLFGGGNSEDVGKNSAIYEYYMNRGASGLQAKEIAENAPTYWGNQPIVEAPAYVGATVLFLFVLALFLVKGKTKYWLVGGTLLSLLLSYGKNLGFLTDFFINYVPLYNKFRAVSSIQVILELCIPVLAVLGLTRLFSSEETRENKLQALKYTVGITAGLAVLLLLFKGAFDFSGGNDAYFRQQMGLDFVTALKEDRKAMFTNDLLRTLVLVLLSAGALFFYLKEKLTKDKALIALGVLLLFDLVGVDRRYVNTDNFVASIDVKKPYKKTAVDAEILKDTSYYRVYDMTSAGARASYFHNSIGGYHAAKLKRFDELNSFYIQNNNFEILNMLNVKYIIAQDDKGNAFPYQNEESNGNAWFVEKLKPVATANDEILDLGGIDNKVEALYNNPEYGNRFDVAGIPEFEVDSTASITLTEHKPNYLKYQYSNPNDGFVVFSEIYYQPGWQAFVDDEKAEHIRVNYVLRGMELPAGNHTVEFRFEPEVVETGSKIALASSIALGVLLLFGVVFGLIKRNQASRKPAGR